MDLDSIITKTDIKTKENWMDYPENPADKIIGEPEVKINLIRQKGAVTPLHRAMLLNIEPSKFKYRFTGDESWYVIRGHVTITLDDGDVVDMKAGDVVSIKGGRDSIWEVHESFQKFVVVSSTQ